MQDYKNRIEAVLFTTGRFMTMEELSQMTGVASQGVLKEALAELRKEYSENIGALELYEEEGKYKLGLKKTYTYLSSKLLSSTEFDRPTQETLAIIAYKHPIIQSDIIKVRGSTAYDHIKTLKESGLITSERSGRTRLIKLTPKFFDYFDVVEADIKDKFGEIAEKVGKVEEVKPEEVQFKIQEAQAKAREIEEENKRLLSVEEEIEEEKTPDEEKHEAE